ncbi:MAG: hypothetical protein ACOYMP_12915 [Nodosilinea sp.]
MAKNPRPVRDILESPIPALGRPEQTHSPRPQRSEELHGDATAGLNLTNVRAYQETWLTIPSNYSRIFSHV